MDLMTCILASIAIGVVWNRIRNQSYYAKCQAFQVNPWDIDPGADYVIKYQDRHGKQYVTPSPIPAYYLLEYTDKIKKAGYLVIDLWGRHGDAKKFIKTVAANIAAQENDDDE